MSAPSFDLSLSGASGLSSGASQLLADSVRFATRSSAQNFAVLNPATGKAIGNVPDLGADETVAAIETARKATRSWADCGAQERADLLTRWKREILAEKDHLAGIVTLEQGKPFAQAIGEIDSGVRQISWQAGEAERFRDEIVPGREPSFIRYEPVGVTAVITPWNFPARMPMGKVAPALAAGCPVILKPAEDTPLTAIILHYLAVKAGIPAEVFQLLPSSRPGVIGAVLTSSEHVRMISFTGSTTVGKWLARQSANSVKRLLLEMGGNAPFLVFEDADLEKAVEIAMATKFRNAGQVCFAPNRFYVHRSVATEFVERFLAVIRRLRLGNGFDPEVEVGPLTNARTLNKVETLVNDAIAQGALALTGGAPARGNGYFYPPTLLEGVHDKMQIAQNEIFGPVAAIQRFETEAEVLDRANGTRSGLAAYVFTEDRTRAQRLARSLEFGMIGINGPINTDPRVPFGGMKESGLGRECGPECLKAYFEQKIIVERSA